MKLNPVLLVGIALPVLFIAILSAVLIVPALSIHPKYDFIYSANDREYAYPMSSGDYRVENGTLVPPPPPVVSSTSPYYPKGLQQPASAPTLYRYDSKTNAVHQISAEEARKLKLDPGPTSPDGYMVSYDYGEGGDLFFSGGNSSGYYIKKGSAGKRLTGISTGYSYNRIQFIGWIIQ